MKKLIVLASLVAILALTGSLYASVAYYEPFNYTAGTNLLDNGYINGHWYGNGQACVIEANSVMYAGLVTSGNKMYVAPGSTKADAFGQLPAAVTSLFQTAGTFYITYVIYGGGSCMDFGILDDPQYPTQMTDVLNLLVYRDPDVSWSWRLLAGGQDSGYNYTYAIGPHFYAFKIQNDGTSGPDSVEMVIDPVLSAGEPNWATQRAWHNTGNITQPVNGFTTGGNLNAQTYDTRVDEIRVATTWAEAAPYQQPTLPPAAPTGLTATPSTKDAVAINLAWTDNADNETGYSVQRALAPDAPEPWPIITQAPLPAGTQTYHDANLLGETHYYYRVSAFNEAGSSAYAAADATTGIALVPQMITYQGKLTNAAGAPVADGTYTLVFKLYDAAAGGSLLWPSADTVVTTSGGLFTAKIQNVPPNVFPANKHVWMEIVVNTETLSPRLEVGSDPYSLRAGLVGLDNVSQ